MSLPNDKKVGVAMDRQQSGYVANYQPCLEANTDVDSVNPAKMIKKLVEHPFFAISQKSNEWFHSGMIAWMIERYHAFGDVFFPNAYIGNCKDSEVMIETEKGHRDITIIIDDNACFVIENKFKSFYNNNQLENYRKALIIGPDDPGYDEYSSTQNRFREGVVLGVIRNCSEPAIGWRYMSYYDVLEGLRKRYEELKKKNQLTGLDSVLIREYLIFLDCMLSILTPYLDNLGEAYWGDKNLVHALDDVGITEFVKVMIAHSFGEYFLLQYGEEVRKMNLLLEFPYTHGGEPCVTFRIKEHCECSIREVSLKLIGNRIIKTTTPECISVGWSGKEPIEISRFDSLAEKIIKEFRSVENRLL